jgi:hypothetical protein
MLIDILNKFLMVLFFVSCLNTIRHTYYFIQAWFTSTDDEPVKYTISNKSLFLLGVSIAYIITSIFTGIKI